MAEIREHFSSRASDPLNLERRTLRVVETLATVRGRVCSSKPKSRKSRRTLRLPQGIVTMLKTHKAKLEATLTELGIEPTRDWVFITPIHPDNLDRSLKRLAKHANVRIIRIHDLRHTYTSLTDRVWRSRSSPKNWATVARASRRTCTDIPSKTNMTRRRSSFPT